MGEGIDYHAKLGSLFDALEGIDLPVEELDLPVSCYNFLKRADVHNIQQLLLMSGDDLMRLSINRKCESCDVIVNSLMRLNNFQAYVGRLFSALEGIDLPLEELDLSVSSYNFLKRVDIHNTQQLFLMSGDDITRIFWANVFEGRKRECCEGIFYKLERLTNDN